MKKYKVLFQSSPFLLFAIIFVFVAFSGIAAWPSGAPQQTRGESTEELGRRVKVEELKVVNQTRAFEVVGIDKIGSRDIRIMLRNSYDKKITGFQVSVGRGRVQTDLTVSGDDTDFILPGHVYEGIYAIQPEIDRRGITILSVMFEDRSSDGNPEAVDEIKYYRLGMKAERKRVLNLLRSALKLNDSEIPSALSQIESQVLSLPVSQDKTLPYESNLRLYNIYFGTRDERMRIGRELQDIRHKNHHDDPEPVNQSLGFRQHLKGLVEYHERIVAKL